MIEIYTDGSSTKTRSGWGTVTIIPGVGMPCLDAGTEPNATNQRMELMAALKALQWWKANAKEDQDVTIYSDSAYFCNCYFEKWYVNWEANGWINSKGEPVANKDLWINIITFFHDPQVNIVKVKGHSGHPYNELADKLATGAITPMSELTIDEENDKINIVLSEILLDYSMKKYPVDETIKRIRKACNCE